MAEPKNPLAEVFGFPISNKSERALHHQTNRLCPFHNVVASCTKSSAVDPLGVCSVFDKDEPTITCPTRFKEEHLVIAAAKDFFFAPGTSFVALPEIRLKDAGGKPAGNIDIVLAAHDERGFVTDFGAIEIQAVYISGNVRRPFREYMRDLSSTTFDWAGAKEYPRPDYLSSSRKRLAPQLIYKGGILKTWGKKVAVVTDRKLFSTLPELEEVDRRRADIAWLVYDLVRDEDKDCFRLAHHRTLHTDFANALDVITKTEAGPVEGFVQVLQEKLDRLKKGEPVADSILAQESLE
jgi:hypothetical protein